MTEQNNEQDPPQGHPAWMELLNEVPEDLHPILTPKLEEWEKNLAAKLQGTTEQYKPYEVYKPLVDNNVPLEDVERALWLASKLNEDPKSVVDEAIRAFNLEYAPVSQQQTPNPPNNEEEEYDLEGLEGLENHPAFQEIKKRAEELAAWREEQEREREEEEASNGLREALDELHNQYDIKREDGTVIPGFDDLYVTALMAQGVDPEAAIKSFNDTFEQRIALAGGNQQQQQVTPPVVMGGDGNTGSGTPQENIRMGDLKNGDVQDLVLQMLKQDNS